MFSIPRVPRRTWLAAVQASALPIAAAGWPRRPRPATPNGMAKLQRPAKTAPERGYHNFADLIGARGGGRGRGQIAACGMCTRHKAYSPPRVAAFSRRRAGVWHGSDAAWTGPWVCTRRRLLGCKRMPPVRQVPRHCVVVLWSAAAVGLCRATTSDGVRNGNAPRYPRRPLAPAGAKGGGRSIGRLLGGEL